MDIDHVAEIVDLDPVLTELVDRAVAGEEIVLEREGKPVARLVGLARDAAERRGFGVLKGALGPAPAGFFDPLTDDEMADWE